MARLSLATKSRTKKIVEALRKALPHAHCELYYETPFQLLVSVVLSAQATDRSVNQAMTKFHKKGLTPKTLIDWREEGILERIKTIGLAPTKSRNLFRLAHVILDKHQGRVPDDRQALEALPGVGRKTANVILGEIFGHPTLAVDTHVMRVTRRLGLHSEETNVQKAEKQLLELIAATDLPQAHHLFIHLGRYTCTARKPSCETCRLQNQCPQNTIETDSKPLPKT